MANVGLFFGSFNPIHVGHIAIANYILETKIVDELWFVITPQNPEKQKLSLLDNHHRYAMVLRAIEPYPKMKASTIEFSLPTPSYTYLTLAHLFDRYKEHSFYLLMGGDNLASFESWKNYKSIIDQNKIIVYNRPGDNIPQHLLNHPSITYIQAPQFDISSSFIRKQIALKNNVRPYLPEAVWIYLDEMNFYKNA